MAPQTQPSERIDPGDGFLFAHGWTVAWYGCQWEVPRPSDLDEPQARLLVRDHPNGEPCVMPREQWCFARDQNGEPVPDDHHVAHQRFSSRAADALVAQRFLLEEDMPLCLDLAAARYDACRQGTATTYMKREKTNMTWTNQMAVVTGAGSGIGRAIAQMMASRGAAVAAVDLDIVTATETVELIAQAGGRAASYQADVSQAAEIDRAVTAAIGDLGPLHIMVNNAGILDGYFNVDETEEDLWRRVIDIDLTSVFLGCKRALREMLPRGSGRIINMASVAGLNGTGGGAAYIAAKHGVVGLTRQMAVVYSKQGITVNCVCPGPIPTNLREHSQELLGPNVPDIRSRGVAVNDDQIRDLIPAGTRGSAQDIASAVCFLASDEASYITGHHLVVDGGWRAK